MHQIEATQQASTAKLPVFFQNFQNTVQWLMVNKEIYGAVPIFM